MLCFYHKWAIFGMWLILVIILRGSPILSENLDLVFFLANGLLNVYRRSQEIVSEKSRSEQACKDSAESIIEWKREVKVNILLFVGK